MTTDEIHDVLEAMKANVIAAGYPSGDVWMRMGPGFNYLNIWTDHNNTISHSDIGAMLDDGWAYINGLDVEEAA